MVYGTHDLSYWVYEPTYNVRGPHIAGTAMNCAQVPPGTEEMGPAHDSPVILIYAGLKGMH